MKKVLEALSAILIIGGVLSVIVAITIDISMVVFSVVAFLIGIVFQWMINVLENQECIISLLEANPNEDEKEENRAE